ncbi:hypothetical protein COLO4_28918 [Corchorus olitorius]|uniref:Uncharacterized protein n=1 Tax=Corchorus olitorius TaxID=93759 RepID=A0A1R3HHM6_9ROSI|nr:hypothetical protein COLO4_28918 [Corchorus olitorius]
MATEREVEQEVTAMCSLIDDGKERRRRKSRVGGF